MAQGTASNPASVTWAVKEMPMPGRVPSTLPQPADLIGSGGLGVRLKALREVIKQQSMSQTALRMRNACRAC